MKFTTGLKCLDLIKKTCDSGLFPEYVNMFLKIKQEASGWPDWVKTNEDKSKYIDDYAKK